MAYKTPLIWYLYDRKNGGCQLRGCVVKTPDGKLGYSWVHKRDVRKATKKLAKQVAFGRAEKCEVFKVSDPEAGTEYWVRDRGPYGQTRYVPMELTMVLDELAAM